MARQLLALVILCGAAFAQDDLADRVRQLEQQLQQERARGEAREKRLRELETSLEKATDALARAQDRRGLQEEIEDYLDGRDLELAVPTSMPRLNIGGVIVGSFRAADLSNGTSFNTFRVEDRFLRVVYRFSDTVTARFYTDGSLVELEWIAREWLQLNLGIVVVPFGQFNQRSFPDTFETLSRPLLYLNSSDTIQPPGPNQPRPVFQTVYSDAGFVVSGNCWKDGDQFYYAAFVTNGLKGVSNLAGGGGGGSDNNKNKQIGARITYTVTSWFKQAQLGFGLSAMGGKFDDADLLDYRMYGADVVYVLQGLFRNGEGALTVRAEYVYAPREYLYGATGDPTTLVNGVNRTQGGYLLVEAALDRRWVLYAEGDWMQQRQPLVTNGTMDPANLAPITSTAWRVSFGVTYNFPIGIIWKNEYAYWDYQFGAPDAHTFATQVVVSF